MQPKIPWNRIKPVEDLKITLSSKENQSKRLGQNRCRHQHSLLEKTKSGKARGHYDGPDDIFRITTTDKEYELINVSEGSEGYKQIETLKNNLENLLKKY
jgi:hypothetical protein